MTPLYKYYVLIKTLKKKKKEELGDKGVKATLKGRNPNQPPQRRLTLTTRGRW
jgi:predicted component of viral defense system (DUF524 family)